MSSNKIICKHPRKGYPWGSHAILRWKQCLPFVFNPRGLLIHRVRSAITFIENGKPRHFAVHYWCANGTTERYCEFFSEPPADKLLCARCEAIASRSGEPSAEQIAGRHVCVGEIRAKRLCCGNESN